jgi:predicted dehydrogenase
MQRRQILQSAAGLTILRSGLLRGQTAPSNRLNVALIGVWGRGTAHYNVLRDENVVALCDVNDLRTKEALAIFPKAKTYYDWRQCLDQKDVEAVIICTADHHHAFIANWAINRGQHVFCEKPLGISVEEVRTVRANYLKNKAKVATQHGTQRHAYPNFERLRELILDGAIGDLKRVHGWDARQLPRPGYPTAQGQPPAELHYEQWIGPSPYHPYSPQYFGGSAGLNCLFWNMYRDFGVGQMGDMGAHTMDLLWNVIDAGAPTGIEVDQDVTDKYHPDICPVKLKVTFEHPANSWRGPIEVLWYQGGQKPEAPRGYVDIAKVPNGAIFEGTKGSIFADFTSRIILPNNDDGDLTYYKRRAEPLPLIGGSGQVTQNVPPRRPPSGPPAPHPPPAQPAARPLRLPGNPDAQRQGARRPGPAQPGHPRHPRRQPAQPHHGRLPARMARRLQRQAQQRHPRHQQQNPLRLRLLRHHDGADAAWPRRASRRQEAHL